MIALLGTLGGVTGIIRLCFGFIFFPISETSFVMQSAKRLFLVRTKDEEFFQDQHPLKKKQWYLEDDHIPPTYSDKESEEIKRHRFIRPKVTDKCCF